MPEQGKKIRFALDLVDDNQPVEGLQGQLRLVQGSQIPRALKIKIVIEWKFLGDGGLAALAFAENRDHWEYPQQGSDLF
jgi:hypothetical protein